MYVRDIKAEPNACGGQIDLCWENPSKVEFPNFGGVKVVRREQRFPQASPPKYDDEKDCFVYDGTLVYDGKEEYFRDANGLHGETIYYYAFYTYDDNPNLSQVTHYTDRTSRVAAMATSDYGLGDALYQLIPAIYKRYDTTYARPGTVAAEDRQKGELQRFLEIFGCQLDVIRNYIAATGKFFNLDECDGALLPLLAQWIGWQTNLSLDLNSQRNEIRYAPELYKTVGIAANLRAIVNRLTNWDCQIKEFVHNVFRSNEPEQLNIWSQMFIDGHWSEAGLVSLDFAYGGAPSAFTDSDGRLCLFYHTQREGKWDIQQNKRTAQWDIWYKIYDQETWSPGYRMTGGETIDKYPTALQTRAGNVWLFYSSHDSKTWNIKTKILAVGRDASKAQLTGQSTEPFSLIDGATFVIRVNGATETTVTFRSGDFEDSGNAACAEVVAVLDRNVPDLTASEKNGKILLTSNMIGEHSSLSIDPDSSTAAPGLGFGAGVPNVPYAEMEPAAFEDETGHIWLFWSSRRAGGWKIWYNCFDGAHWGTAKRLTNGLEADREPAVVFDSADNGKIWVFWSRKKSHGLWNIFYRTTTNLDFDSHSDSDWTEHELSVDSHNGESNYDRKEPAAILLNSGNIELYFSSSRTGSGNIWHKTFDKAKNGWTVEASVTSGPFTQKAPAIFQDSEGTPWLVFRSNESLVYSSKVYPGTTTLDSRYSGSTTIDVRNRARIGGHGQLEDILHYTYDTGKKNEDWYARDTIGIYLSPDTENQQLITRSQELVKGILHKFLPIQLRTVFIINPSVYKESIYPSDHPLEDTFFDTMESTTTDIYSGLNDRYQDTISEWIWFHSVDITDVDHPKYRDHRTVKLGDEPEDKPENLNFRTWHIGIEKQEDNLWKS